MHSRLPARKLAFPDANVLLHGKALHLIPWPAVLQCQEAVLVLSRSVLGELDKFTHVGAPALRSRAKKRATALFKLRKGEGLVRMPPGTSLEFAGTAKAATYERHELNRDWADDRLLALVLERSSEKSDSCVIVTIDYNMTNIADAHGLQWEVLAEKYRLPVPADPHIAQLRREVDSLKHAQRLASIRVTSEGPRGVMGLTRPEHIALSDEQLEAEMADIRRRHPRMAARRPGSPIFYPDRDRQSYNQELEEAYKSYAEYLRQREAHRFLTECTRTARLTIFNEGSAPAGDVQVHLKLNAPGMAFVEPSRLDKAPKPPKFPKHQWDSLAALSMIGPRYGPPVPRPKPSRLLKVPDETHSVYELDRLMHGLPETVDIPIVLDPSSAASGTLSFSTHADGQPAATHGEIAIVVSD